MNTLALTQDGIVLLTGLSSVAQRIREAARFLQGEWFAYPTQGVPYHMVLGRTGTNQLLEGLLVQAIEGVADVIAANVDVAYLEEENKYRVFISANTVFGQLDTQVTIL